MEKNSSKQILILSIINLLVSLWFLIVGTYAFATHSHIDEATIVQLLASLYSLAFSIIMIVKSKKL